MSSNKTRKKCAKVPKIVYGSVNLSEEEFSPKATRLLVSLMLREDVVNWLKEEAKVVKSTYKDVAEALLTEAFENKHQYKIKRL